MTANLGNASQVNMNDKNITVAGSGVSGSQIAFQTVYRGFPVMYDIPDEALGHTQPGLTKLTENCKEDLCASQQAVDEAFSRISQDRIPGYGHACQRQRARLLRLAKSQLCKPELPARLVERQSMASPESPVTVGEPALLGYSR